DARQACVGVFGCVTTMTLEEELLGSDVGKVKNPSAAILTTSPPLFCSCSPLPCRPVTVKPIENSVVTQSTCTLLIFSPPIVPDGFVTVHTCAGPVGCAATVTLYCVPLGAGAKVKVLAPESRRTSLA